MPEHFIPGSHKKIWWKCEREHEWDASIYSRSNGGKKYPICFVRKFYKHGCLAEENPDLAKEWHPTKNGSLTPMDVGPSSHKKVWWIDPLGEWQARIDKRTRKFNR